MKCLKSRPLFLSFLSYFCSLTYPKPQGLVTRQFVKHFSDRSNHIYVSVPYAVDLNKEMARAAQNGALSIRGRILHKPRVFEPSHEFS
jgi:hypothetical protein